VLAIADEVIERVEWGLLHAAAKATEATAPEATEAATATPSRIGGHTCYEATREAAIQKKPRRSGASST
jgi:hypothetical protein